MPTLSLLDTKPAPRADVISKLEEALELAKSGELQGFILAGVLHEPADPACTLVMRAGSGPIAPSVVALERAKLRLMGFIEDVDIGRQQAGF